MGPGQPGKGQAPKSQAEFRPCSPPALPSAPLIGHVGSKGEAGCRDVHLPHCPSTGWHKPSWPWLSPACGSFPPGISWRHNKQQIPFCSLFLQQSPQSAASGSTKTASLWKARGQMGPGELSGQRISISWDKAAPCSSQGSSV